MEYSKQIIKRVKIIDGQMKGVLKMMDEGKDCEPVIHQLTAARSAIAATIRAIFSDDLTHCLCNRDEGQENFADLVREKIKQFW